jgi:hypothetical protein
VNGNIHRADDTTSPSGVLGAGGLGGVAVAG